MMIFRVINSNPSNPSIQSVEFMLRDIVNLDKAVFPKLGFGGGFHDAITAISAPKYVINEIVDELLLNYEEVDKINVSNILKFKKIKMKNENCFYTLGSEETLINFFTKLYTKIRDMRNPNHIKDSEFFEKLKSFNEFFEHTLFATKTTV